MAIYHPDHPDHLFEVCNISLRCRDGRLASTKVAKITPSMNKTGQIKGKQYDCLPGRCCSDTVDNGLRATSIGLRKVLA